MVNELVVRLKNVRFNKTNMTSINGIVFSFMLLS